MPRRDARLVTVSVVAMASLVLGQDKAGAAGFQLREQSADGMSNAMAGSAAKAYDLSTVFYNPAGMARLDGNQTGVGVAWIAPSSQFEGGNIVGGMAVAGSDGGNHAQSVAVGSAYMMWDAAPDWRLGLAVTSPFGMRSSYDDDWVGRYHALDTTLTTVNVSPSVSYRINDALSVALGVQVGYLDARQTNALNFGAVVPGASDGLFRVSGNHMALGWTSSLLYQFTPSTRLGLSYRSSIRHAIHGRAEFQGVPAALAGNRAFADSDIDVVVTLPDTLTLGLYHEISPEWAVMSDVAWTRWSTFRTLRLEFESGRPDIVEPENWHDTGFFSVGVTYRPNDRLGVHVGTAYDRAAVGDRFRNARLPESNRFWLSSGLSYAPSPTHQFTLSYTHIFADTATIDRTTPDQIGGRLRGHYDSHVDIISANYTLRF